MENVLNLQQPVIDYIATLTVDADIETALNYATQNTDCGVESVKQAVELSHG